MQASEIGERAHRRMVATLLQINRAARGGVGEDGGGGARGDDDDGDDDGDGDDDDDDDDDEEEMARRRRRRPRQDAARDPRVLELEEMALVFRTAVVDMCMRCQRVLTPRMHGPEGDMIATVVAMRALGL